MRPDLSQSRIEQLADRCVQCGLCLPHCPTYSLDLSETESPRGRIAYMRALASGLVLPSNKGRAHLDQCLGCRRCESVCPAQVAYGELLNLSRSTDQARPRLGLRSRVALSLLARPALLSWLMPFLQLLRVLPRAPLPRALAAARTLPSDAPQIAVFSGCLGRTDEVHARRALSVLLSHCGIRSIEPPGQGCCGTAALHSGDIDAAERLSAQNQRAFAGTAGVISLASGCHTQLHASLDTVSATIDAMTYLARHGQHLRFRPYPNRVALHFPCTLQQVDGAKRACLELLHRIPELDLVLLPDHGCCGAAGLHMIEFPDRARQLRDPLQQSIERSGAHLVLSANIGCRSHLRHTGTIDAIHPLEFLAEQLQS